MEISFKNNSCRLTYANVSFKVGHCIYICCFLTIKWKKVLLNQLFEEAKWESGLRVSNYFQYAVYLEPLLACVENSILCLSFFSLHLSLYRPTALSLCSDRTSSWPRAEKDVWYGHYLPENKLHSMLRVSLHSFEKQDTDVSRFRAPKQ